MDVTTDPAQSVVIPLKPSLGSEDNPEGRRIHMNGKIRFLGINGHNRAFHAALAQGPLSPDELARIRSIGDYVHG